ncbi:putative Seg-like homing endonuclease, GIY-YIG family [Escherichia phage Ec_Makalu_001]|uniref:GIY-YIG domain-containing protein n=2 Tax=Krischvirus TaxID=1913651 RepID=A0A345BRW6_9CAUD|nr:homing endonuclease [Escherichia virus KFS-EC]AXF53187.1 hypothetical protein [Escherichia virus KFS-EC]QHJ73368.1 putative Seg-like homing endonuclease, GIY-YIG family [Escherichia phage Ec_Makalu_001]
MEHYVYKITNKINDKIYVGVRSCDGLAEDDTKYMGSGKIIKQAIKHHGLENFTKEILSKFDSREDADKEEARIVTVDFVKREDTYNIAEGGGTVCMWKVSDEAKIEEMRKKISEKNTGRKHTKDTRQKMSASQKGRKHTEETKEKMRQNNLGKVIAEETKEKLRMINLGKRHTEETRRKMSDSHKGLSLSDEVKDKIRQKHTGRVFTKEWRERISKSRIGITSTRSRRISINGVIYNSIGEAVIKLNVKRGLIVGRLKSNTDKNKNYFFVD